MIINYASRAVSKWCHNLERDLELPNMLLEASIMLLDDIYGTGITHDDWYDTRDMFIVQATGANVIKLLCVNDGAAK
jgi:hypothetical protein